MLVFVVRWVVGTVGSRYGTCCILYCSTRAMTYAQIEHSRHLHTHTHSCFHTSLRPRLDPCKHPTPPLPPHRHPPTALALPPSHRRPPRTAALASPPPHHHLPTNTGRAGAVHPHGGRIPAGGEAEPCCRLRQGHDRVDCTSVGCRCGHTGGCGAPRGMAVTRGSKLCACWPE